MQTRRIAIGLVLTTMGLGPVGQTAAADMPTVAIGVISPEQGRSSSTGIAHRASIEWAFQEIGYYVLGGNQHVQLRPIYRDDRGDPDESVRVAEKLVKEDNVVALLGPANSSCAEKVVAAGLGVPIISSLSSAPALTESRDDPNSQWFFRATIDDRERMRRFAAGLRAKALLGQHAVLIYEDDAYGRGLETSLTESLGGSDVQATRWQDVTAEPGAFVTALPEGTLSVFVLGTEDGGLEIANRLDELLRQDERRKDAVRFFFVGDGEPLVHKAPAGSFTIGEPVPDADVADAPWTIGPFVTQRSKFLLTAYEAARFVLPKALQYALASGISPDNVPELRRKLKTVLESQSFDSLTPWRKIKFDAGGLVEPPATPIYQLSRTFERVDPAPPAPWVTVAVPAATRFLEEPVVIALERHGPNVDEPVQVQILDDDAKLIDAAVVSPKDGRGTYIFHPRSPGHFRIWTNVIPVPNEPVVDVGYPFDYVIAALGGILGVAIAAGGIPLFGRAAQGILVGIVLFALTSYGRAIPGLNALPVPSLSAWQPMNALLSGILGGWGGLKMLIELVRKLLPGWFSPQSPEPPAPERPAEAAVALPH